MDVNWTYCNDFTVVKYTSNLYSEACQLFLNKIEKESNTGGWNLHMKNTTLKFWKKSKRISYNVTEEQFFFNMRNKEIAIRNRQILLFWN